jgi:hypothetical protein
MIKGRVTHMGRIEIDGEFFTGVFISCEKGELKNNLNLFNEEVTIGQFQPQDSPD